MQKFEDSSNWEERGLIEVSKDYQGKILGVRVRNNPINAAGTMKQEFENACNKNKFYQLSVPDFDVFTSIPACQYAKNGFNETLVF